MGSWLITDKETHQSLSWDELEKGDMVIRFVSKYVAVTPASPYAVACASQK